MIGFKNSNLKIFDALDEKYAVIEKIIKTWKMNIEHKMIYWNGIIIVLLKRKFGKNIQKNKPTLGLVVFIIIPCLIKFLEMFNLFLFWLWITKK